jgi:hypothetical protein
LSKLYKMNKMLRLNTLMICLSVLLLFFANAGFSQITGRLAVEFIIDGNTLANPLTGGLNAPQLSEVDLDEDGLMDLYIFDRIGNRHLTFLNSGESSGNIYTYAPEFEANFPSVNGWLLLRDYDGDGIMDIFAYSDQIVSGVIVFKGFYEDGKINFIRINFDELLNMIFVPIPSGGSTQLYISEIDVPAIDDIDCDGDLDIMTFSVGGGYIDWYKNVSVESGFGMDSLHYELETNCWGGIFESGISNELNLAAVPGDCFEGFWDGEIVDERHAGSTLLTFDRDGDGDKELALGDISFTNLILLDNGGDCEEAWFNDQESNFPAEDVAVDMPIFPAGFYLDVDNDGLKDLLVSPNSTTASEDFNALWFYKNTGSTSLPNFDLQQKNFLIDQMVDFGSGAQPAFVDYNADGLLDLVVGNYSYFVPFGERDPRLFLFLNTGTAEDPEFTLEDDDFLGMSQYAQSSYNFAPTFGDLDGDGDKDIIIGEQFGQLFYGENTAGPGNPISITGVTYNYLEINVGQASVPQVVDLNRDGLKDLVIGEKNGNVNYFVNTGTTTSPAFESDPSVAPNNFFLGGIDTRIPGYSTGHSAPFIIDSETEGFKIYTGSEIGRIEVYSGIDGNLDGTFVAETENFGALAEGIRTHLVMEDLNNDGLLEVILGNFAGGLEIFGTDIPKYVNVATENPNVLTGLRVFPNPANDKINLLLDNEQDFTEKSITIYDKLGRQCFNTDWDSNAIDLNVSNFASGVYFIEIISNGQQLVEKLVIE